MYAQATVQPFAVVIALLAVAGLGWLLSRGARRMLHRYGVPTDERDVPEVSRPTIGEDGGDERDAAILS